MPTAYPHGEVANARTNATKACIRWVSSGYSLRGALLWRSSSEVDIFVFVIPRTIAC